MKTNIKLLLCTLICIIMSTAAVAKGNIVWNKLETGSVQNGFKFHKVEFTPEATIIHFDFTYKQTFQFPHHTRLITDQGEVLSFVRTEGVESGKWIEGTDSKAIPVTMYFAPARKPVRWFHYYEGKERNDWKTLFIRKAGTKIPNEELPSVFRNIIYDNQEQLPTTKFSPTPAKLHIYTNVKSLDLELSTFIDHFGDTESNYYSTDIKNGEAIFSAQLFFPRTQSISIGNTQFGCIMEPGKDVYCYVDLSKKAGEKGSIVFAGHMAKTNQELADKKLSNICELKFEDPSYLCTTDTLLSVEQRIDMIASVMKSKIDSINRGKYSDNVKALLRMNTEISNQLLCYNYGALLNRSKLFDKEQIYAKADSMLPTLAAVKFMEQSPREMNYAPYATLCPGLVPLSVRHTDPDGKENTYLKDLTYLSGFLANMAEERYLELIKSPEMHEYAEVRQSEYQARVDSLKSLQIANIHFKELDDVAPEAILDTITSRYKGKAILIDIWATWCGPCRQGHKTMAPFKEEMKDKDISFVYITSPSSPELTWHNMISEISGDHYYLTREQYSYILSKYNSDGIPTYIIFDKDGNSQYSHIGFPSLDELRGEINKAM